ncbi:class I SAM-dependent methyltransferase [Streptomyces sp. NBC_00654]|uniref:class I SAM-dependent methyltransferase n=1 Tax=Streptomyces sp. NBC_00654 TaxID=2975799 RepID=UPI00224D4DAF|nr:class I SAM-dependent methyltransferase [Streptomyces sp. NBC_00654]MCX4967038.1 class I SAM-dependent methyltransferase [Streptomyces sp. NBC_00654]
MTEGQFKNPRTLPHESDQERTARVSLTELMLGSPIPSDYLLDSLSLYMRRHQLVDMLSMDALYRMSMKVPGVVMEFGVFHGRHLATFTALRNIYEPYNSTRRIIGFDTFTGFPDLADLDRVSPSASLGRFATPSGYADHLRDVLDAHESLDPLAHIQRTMVVEGDVRETLPTYLSENPQTVVALAYFDLDIYEPTRAALDAIRPYLTNGSILAFDEIAHPKWPGETAALRETLGDEGMELRMLDIQGREAPIAYVRWNR